MSFESIIGHDRPKQILRAVLAKERVAHAYLFFGEEGIGKSLTAKMFAQAVNCEEPIKNGSDACGQCWACKQVENSVHPDVFTIAPDGDQIKIAQIREMQDYLVYRPLIGRYKIYTIEQADRMNASAANSLLKTLEEPPDHSLIILTSARPRHLLPTIRSRCQGLRFAPLSNQEVQAALETHQDRSTESARILAGFSQGRLGVAYTVDPDGIRQERDRVINTIGLDALMEGGVVQVFNAAETITKGDSPAAALTWLVHWLRDMLIVKTSDTPKRVMNHDRLTELTTASQHISSDAIIGLLEGLETMRQGMKRNLNAQLQLEVILLNMYDAFAKNHTP